MNGRADCAIVVRLPGTLYANEQTLVVSTRNLNKVKIEICLRADYRFLWRVSPLLASRVGRHTEWKCALCS